MRIEAEETCLAIGQLYLGIGENAGEAGTVLVAGLAGEKAGDALVMGIGEVRIEAVAGIAALCAASVVGVTEAAVVHRTGKTLALLWL